MKKAVTLAVLSLIVLTHVTPATTQPLAPSSAEALGAVLRMLMNPSQRGPAIAADPRATAADSGVRALAGSDKLMEEFYGLIVIMVPSALDPRAAASSMRRTSGLSADGTSQRYESPPER